MVGDTAVHAGSSLNPEPARSIVPLDVLHVPFTYYPDPVGGTETYVAGLTRALTLRGVTCAVAAPGEIARFDRHAGIAVYRFITSARQSLENAWGEPDVHAAQAFAALVDRVRPRLIHLHARTAAVSERLAEIAHAAGAKVVFTYHTPTVSCARGTMMWLGRSPCDGELDVPRCAACVLQGRGAPVPLARALAANPQAIGRMLGTAGLSGGAFTALRVSALVGTAHKGFRALANESDQIVAICEWAAELLRRNNVPAHKITLCRRGIGPRSERDRATPDKVGIVSSGPLRIGYFGRLDPTKGVDILIEALRRAPDAAVRLDIYGVRQAGSEAYAAKLELAAAADPRVSIQAALTADAVEPAMAACDMVAVPSRWFEAEPMVVLEAFAAGTPVLGARLGGIAELVSDGVDGVLVETDAPDVWSAAIVRLVADREYLATLRTGVRPPRSMEDVAADMAVLYDSLLGQNAG